MEIPHNFHGCYTGTSDILVFVVNFCDVFSCMEVRHIWDVCFVTNFHAWKSRTIFTVVIQAHQISLFSYLMFVTCFHVWKFGTFVTCVS